MFQEAWIDNFYQYSFDSRLIFALIGLKCKLPQSRPERLELIAKAYQLLILNIMKKGRFTEHQIVSALKKHEAGLSIKDLSRELGIIVATKHVAIGYWQCCYRLWDKEINPNISARIMALNISVTI